MKHPRMPGCQALYLGILAHALADRLDYRLDDTKYGHTMRIHYSAHSRCRRSRNHPGISPAVPSVRFYSPSKEKSIRRKPKAFFLDLGRIELPPRRCHRRILPLNYRPTADTHSPVIIFPTMVSS